MDPDLWSPWIQIRMNIFKVPGSGSGSAFLSGFKVLFYFYHVKNTVFGKNQIPYPKIFQTQDPDPHEIDLEHK